MFLVIEEALNLKVFVGSIPPDPPRRTCNFVQRSFSPTNPNYEPWSLY